jgi:hypothetical protein
MIKIDDVISKNFLTELHQQTKGDMQAQVSMYEVGAAIGLAKGEAGSRAEELMVAGLMELRTLAGGISITPEGLAALGMSVPSPPVASQDLRLSSGPVVNAADRRVLEGLVEEIKQDLPGAKLGAASLEGIIFDLKTIEVHLLSPSPKVAVVRELLRSLLESFQAGESKTVVTKLAGLIG